MKYMLLIYAEPGADEPVTEAAMGEWFAFTQTIGQGLCAVKDALADRYCERTGIEIDERRLAYYRLLEMTKGSIIVRSGAYDLAHGGDELRLLTVAAIATAGQPILVNLEEQLVQLLEA